MLTASSFAKISLICGALVFFQGGLRKTIFPVFLHKNSVFVAFASEEQLAWIENPWLTCSENPVVYTIYVKRDNTVKYLLKINFTALF